jgi:hypothetical protein
VHLHITHTCNDHLIDNVNASLAMGAEMGPLLGHVPDSQLKMSFFGDEHTILERRFNPLSWSIFLLLIPFS